MKQSTPGFSLIELLVATMISAIIGVMLSVALFQTTKIQRTVQDISDTSMRIAIFQYYMERDVAGAFVPLRAVWQPKKTDQKGPQREQPQEESKDAAMSPDKESQKEQERSEVSVDEKNKPAKPLEHICVGTQKNGMLDTLTFITSNPIMVFSGGPLGRLKSHIARVVYTLRPDGSRKDSYVLFRQEGSPLEFEKYKNSADGLLRPYELLRGIKSMKVSYVSYEAGKDGKELEKNIALEWKKSLKEEKDTDKKESAEKKDQKEKKQPILLPSALHVTVSLWDSAYVREHLFEFEMPIAAPDVPVIKKDESINQSQKQQPVTQATLQPNPVAQASITLNISELGSLI